MALVSRVASVYKYIRCMHVLVHTYVHIYNTRTRTGPPPKEPPAALVAQFTLNHTVPLAYYYVDDSNRGKG